MQNKDSKLNIVKFYILLALDVFLTVFLSLCCFACVSNNISNQEICSEEQIDMYNVDYSDIKTLTDTCDRQVHIPVNVSRIVALSPSDVEVLCDLDAKDLIIAKGEDCDYPSIADDVMIVGSGASTNIEQIASLQPDVVLMSKMNQSLGQVEALTSIGIPVVVNSADTINKTYDYISLLGDISNKEENAHNIIDAMKQTFIELSGKKSNKSIYFEIAPQLHDLWTAGNNTIINEIAETIGIDNVFVDLEGYSNISSEETIKRNPDYIIYTYKSDYHDMQEEDISSISNRPGWGTISAIKNKEIHAINDGSLTRPGPRLTDAAKQMYSIIYNNNKLQN